ncbi:hypothetical protein RCL_jg26002.t1 [Rhizophagus clarus]|uniref:Uncharacterized protein n=1 Tax=Rhizophagus clarus TaxID=94130 RepID=A0A8H3QHL7_9GLOM|nr:hypothetical protein RCL_jg26002.t1 [Rhizophagus clarus]
MFNHCLTNKIVVNLLDHTIMKKVKIKFFTITFLFSFIAFSAAIGLPFSNMGVNSISSITFSSSYLHLTWYQLFLHQ